MVDEPDGPAAAHDALQEVMSTIASTSVRAAQEMGVDFDVEDPRVARWLILTTFEALYFPAAATPSATLLESAADVPVAELETVRRKRKAKRPNGKPLVTWSDLVASNESSAELSRNSKEAQEGCTMPISARSESDATITLRMPDSTLELIDSAAATLGKSRTEFMVESARLRALDVFLDQRVFSLDADAGEAFARALEHPSAPVEALRSLMANKSPQE